MVMTLEQAAFELRAASSLALSITNRDWYNSIADAIDANLSAQAKVRVTDEDVERAVEAYDSASPLPSDMCMRAALESFAARLSQGAQGEAVDQILREMLSVATSEDDSDPLTSEWTSANRADVDRWQVILRAARYPAERAAVPDGLGWSDDDVETLRSLRKAVSKYARLGPLWIPYIDKLLTRAQHVTDPCFMPYKRTAAPQPPEGARVVDGWQPIDTAPKSTADGKRVNGIYLLGFTPDSEEDFDRQAIIDIIWWEPLLRNPRGGRGVWRRSAAGESVDVEPTHWMPLPAAPTLAGKEGA